MRPSVLKFTKQRNGFYIPECFNEDRKYTEILLDYFESNLNKPYKKVMEEFPEWHGKDVGFYIALKELFTEKYYVPRDAAGILPPNLRKFISEGGRIYLRKLLYTFINEEYGGYVEPSRREEAIRRFFESHGGPELLTVPSVAKKFIDKKKDITTPADKNIAVSDLSVKYTPEIIDLLLFGDYSVNKILSREIPFRPDYTTVLTDLYTDLTVHLIVYATEIHFYPTTPFTGKMFNKIMYSALRSGLYCDFPPIEAGEPLPRFVISRKEKSSVSGRNNAPVFTTAAEMVSEKEGFGIKKAESLLEPGGESDGRGFKIVIYRPPKAVGTKNSAEIGLVRLYRILLGDPYRTYPILFIKYMGRTIAVDLYPIYIRLSELLKELNLEMSDRNGNISDIFDHRSDLIGFSAGLIPSVFGVGDSINYSGIDSGISDEDEKSPPDFDSRVESVFYDIMKLKNRIYGKLTRESDIIITSEGVFIPDFMITYGSESIFIEIVGFWTASYIDKKIKKLRALLRSGFPPSRLILYVDENIGFPVNDPELSSYPIVLYGRNRSDINGVLEIIERWQKKIFDERKKKLARKFAGLRGELSAEKIMEEEEIIKRIGAESRAELRAFYEFLGSDESVKPPRKKEDISATAKRTAEKEEDSGRSGEYIKMSDGTLISAELFRKWSDEVNKAVCRIGKKVLKMEELNNVIGDTIPGKYLGFILEKNGYRIVFRNLLEVTVVVPDKLRNK